MKHLLNNLSSEEKNSIREQHAGGMKVMTENFSKLINAKSGDVKPLVSEQDEMDGGEALSDSVPTADKIKELSDNLLFKSLENWYGSPQWMSVFKDSTGWKENMSRNESDGKENHPCIIGGVDYDNQTYEEPKFFNQDTEIPQRCKTYLKDNYKDYLNKFLVKNGFVDGYEITDENYSEMKKLYHDLMSTHSWEK